MLRLGLWMEIRFLKAKMEEKRLGNIDELTKETEIS